MALRRTRAATAGFARLRGRLNSNDRPHSQNQFSPPRMRTYFQSWWVKIGVALLILGSAPLVLIIAAAAVGLWPDPNPNPIGPGLLFLFTFWPAVICILIGVVRVYRANRGA